MACLLQQFVEIRWLNLVKMVNMGDKFLYFLINSLIKPTGVCVHHPVSLLSHLLAIPPDSHVHDRRGLLVRRIQEPGEQRLFLKGAFIPSKKNTGQTKSYFQNRACCQELCRHLIFNACVACWLGKMI